MAIPLYKLLTADPALELNLEKEMLCGQVKCLIMLAHELREENRTHLFHKCLLLLLQSYFYPALVLCTAIAFKDMRPVQRSL